MIRDTRRGCGHPLWRDGICLVQFRAWSHRVEAKRVKAVDYGISGSTASHLNRRGRGWIGRGGCLSRLVMSRCYRCRCGCWDWGRFCRSSHQSHRQSGAVRLGFGVGLIQVLRIFGRGIFVDMIKALTLAWSERLPLSHSYPSWRMPVGDRDLLALRAHHWRVSIRGTLAWARERRILSGRIPGRRMRKGAPQLVGHREIRALPNVNPGLMEV